MNLPRGPIKKSVSATCKPKYSLWKILLCILPRYLQSKITLYETPYCLLSPLISIVQESSSLATGLCLLVFSTNLSNHSTKILGNSLKKPHASLCTHTFATIAYSLTKGFYSPSEKILFLFVPTIWLSLSSLDSKTFPHFQILAPGNRTICCCMYTGRLKTLVSR
jgi:hypothetical protein